MANKALKLKCMGGHTFSKDDTLTAYGDDHDTIVLITRNKNQAVILSYDTTKKRDKDLKLILKALINHD